MKRILYTLLACGALTACIENDIPYPVVKIAVEAIEADGLAGDPIINAARQSVTLPLDETTDIRAVNIRTVRITEGGRSSVAFPGTFDLRTPLYATLSLYQDYDWMIEAQQEIERYFTVRKQIGGAEIDPLNHTARVYVPRSSDLERIEVTSLKLGPRDITTLSPQIEGITSFATVRMVDVTYHGRTEHWRLEAVPADVEVRILRCDAWARRVYLSGSGLSDTQMGFRYRLKGTDSWTEVPGVSVSGGEFSACLRGLEPLTAYEIVAYSDDAQSDIREFTTEAAAPLLNGSFDEWYEKPKENSDGKFIYFPYSASATEEERMWDTGNPGSMTLNINVTTPDSPRTGSTGRYSARLASDYPSLLGIGKFAAGNLFTGYYAGTEGTNGIVNFATSFTGRPTKLRGWMKYQRGTVNHVGDKLPAGTIAKGDPDQAIIYIAMGTWTPEKYGGTARNPLQAKTRYPETFFDPQGEDVVGYGELVLGESVNDWTEFTIELDYRSTQTVPTHLMIVCSASRWGDYFTGSTDSVLWVDDFELIYD